MTLAIGIDVGTQGTKVIVIDAAEPRVVARAARAYDLIEGLAPGAAEQHPETWRDAIRECCAELTARGVAMGDVTSVGVSGQQHGLCALDEADEVVRPAKLWCDTQTAPEARELSEAVGHAVPTGFTASKILWLARHEPENWARVRRVLLPHDYVNLLLTGQASMEYGDASGTGFFDPRERRFDERVMSAIDARLAECLPELGQPGEAAGSIDAAGAELTGVQVGTLVAAGGGDNMMSAIGSGATCAGTVVVSLGTSGTVFTHADEPVVDPEGLIAPFCGSTGGWMPLLCVMNLTGVSEEVVGAFALDHEELTRRASRVEPGCEGLLFLPYLAGERVPDLPEATGTLLGVRAGHLQPGALFRAALEGTSLNLAWGVDRLRGLGVEVSAVNLVGGAARNPLWREVLAACLDARVTPLAEPESAALGAALQGLWTRRRAEGEQVSADEVARPYIAASAEVTEPDARLVELYAERQQTFRREVARLYG